MRRIWKALVFVILLVGFVMLCMVGVLENGGTKMKRSSLEVQIEGSLQKHMEVTGRKKGDADNHAKLDLHFMMSKRRVPNGPDPIHNRRAGNSRQSPGKA